MPEDNPTVHKGWTVEKVSEQYKDAGNYRAFKFFGDRRHTTCSFVQLEDLVELIDEIEKHDSGLQSVANARFGMDPLIAINGKTGAMVRVYLVGYIFATGRPFFISDDPACVCEGLVAGSLSSSDWKFIRAGMTRRVEILRLLLAKHRKLLDELRTVGDDIINATAVAFPIPEMDTEAGSSEILRNERDSLTMATAADTDGQDEFEAKSLP